MEKNTTAPGSRPRLRRAHLKSRRGCRQCKLRRVKCDEVEPCCSQCHRQRITCGFQQHGRVASLPGVPKVPIPRSHQSEAVAQHSLEAILPATSPSSSSSPSPSISEEYGRSAEASLSDPSPVCEASLLTPRQLRYQDQQLRGLMAGGSLDNCLFYYYVNWCAWQTTRDTAAVLSWIVPRLAPASQCLMDATLAFAANELRIQHPGNALFVRASHGYIARAIATQARKLASGITRTNFESLYLTACMIAIHTLLQRRFDSTHSGEEGNITVWFHAWRGLRAITLARPGLYLDSSIACSFPPGGWQNPFKGDVDCSAIHPDLEFLLDALNEEHERRPLDYESHRHALGYISQVLWRPSRPLCVRFLVEARQPFIDSVSRGEQMALLITAVYLSNMQFMPGLEVFMPSVDHDWNLIARLLKPAYRDLLDRGSEVVANTYA
ncbi:hypothetical protein NLU13_7551 [Sarocladium strictum]|uniref:Zn(2)-C6 fungal-type domain-containing protein n=1 Tax=Sarocladium strictum TaxID=5046 RepID=A0AA39GD04_SARSR|nr:hypothetical protein NLU13_7551 [Sarocladium strictum]